ncbi:flagellar basal body rod protein FlgB [Ideonella sp. DXS22W]|uniref:Flagellar basal body rod protein FlgB n=1 Tax=Pseudaquabacterium inlustre TaxID=2984192 RepID=A0ABU9C9X0_9BURK
MQRLTQTLDFQANALVLRAERQRLIASNIANADTPGYQAREMDFAQALREATGQAQAAGTMAATHAGHFGTAPTSDGEPPNLLYARYSQDSVDRNTVDLDRERASFAENTVRYEAALRFINGSVRTLTDAMKSPSQG